jgi:hypothetical protein
MELICDKSIATISVMEASLILGIGRTTAHNSIKKTGCITDGVPVLRVGKRCVISLAHIRTALNLDENGKTRAN